MFHPSDWRVKVMFNSAPNWLTKRIHAKLEPAAEVGVERGLGVAVAADLVGVAGTAAAGI